MLPGGLTRIAGAELEIASMQRGGSSADTWVLTDGEVDATSLLQHDQPAVEIGHRSRSVTSRAAENLFWLGRYTERTENTARLARLTLESLNGEDQSSQPLLAWLSEMAVASALVLPAVPPATQSRRVFERSLIAGLGDTGDATSVGYNLSALRQSGVRRARAPVAGAVERDRAGRAGVLPRLPGPGRGGRLFVGRGPARARDALGRTRRR